VVNRVIALLVKDIRIELRRGHEILASIAFVSIASLAMSLFAYKSQNFEFVVPSLWLFTLFISIFISMITFVSEHDKNTLVGLRILPISPSLIFVSKAIFTYLITVVESMVALVLLSIFSSTWILFNPVIILVLFVFTLYLAGVSSFTSLLVMYSEGRSFLIPVLIFILSVPLLSPLVTLSMPDLPSSFTDLGLLFAGSISFFMVAIALSEFILEV